MKSLKLAAFLAASVALPSAALAFWFPAPSYTVLRPSRIPILDWRFLA